ncbi:thioesterase domain-containing protein [Methylomonas sp. HYX-M1]|uniref:thioesterase domain-containing protein n=1 Tax=Methylomonas sp. HYX-M1 TaxID=3139307 RepID=UPI00345C0139
MLAQPGVAQAAVRVDSQGRLLAYAALTGAGATDPDTLRLALSRQLPDYMLPAHILLMPQLPTLPNGKLDRNALPEAERAVAARTAPRSALERQLAEIWQEVLGLETVGVDDNFFELGGHSLLALRLVSAIKRRLGWDLPLSRLLQNPTIAALAAGADNGLSPLVELNKAAGALPPLFCLHPAGGTVFGYYPLARALAGQRPVIGVLCRSFLNPDWRDLSLQQMADDYAEAIRQRQPHGALHLLGWSLGGALALSIAARLQQEGREVAFLGLVDGFVPGFDAEADDQDDSDHLGGLLDGIATEGAGLSPAQLTALPERLSREHPGADWVKLLDLQNGMAIMQHLTALSSAYRLPQLATGMHCWWSAAAGDAADMAQDVVEQACGNRVLRSTRIDSDHAGIVRHPDLLADLVTLLGKDGDGEA